LLGDRKPLTHIIDDQIVDCEAVDAEKFVFLAHCCGKRVAGSLIGVLERLNNEAGSERSVICRSSTPIASKGFNL
jgi:hypothetical protein